jgi:hypothetical protein
MRKCTIQTMPDGLDERVGGVPDSKNARAEIASSALMKMGRPVRRGLRNSWRQMLRSKDIWANLREGDIP